MSICLRSFAVVSFASGLFLAAIWVLNYSKRFADITWWWIAIGIVMALCLDQCYRRFDCTHARLIFRSTFLICVLFFAAHSQSGYEQYSFFKYLVYVVLVGSFLGAPVSAVLALVELISVSFSTNAQSH